MRTAFIVIRAVTAIVAFLAIAIVVGLGLGSALQSALASTEAPAHSNRLFCPTDNPINPCFTMETVAWFIPHDRALLFNAGYGWTLTAPDWARLVEFAKARGYEIPPGEGVKGDPTK